MHYPISLALCFRAPSYTKHEESLTPNRWAASLFFIFRPATSPSSCVGLRRRCRCWLPEWHGLLKTGEIIGFKFYPPEAHLPGP
jgi:hypothetical protein